MALQVPRHGVTFSRFHGIGAFQAHFDVFGRHFHEVVEFFMFLDVIIMGSSILGTPGGTPGVPSQGLE